MNKLPRSGFQGVGLLIAILSLLLVLAGCRQADQSDQSDQSDPANRTTTQSDRSDRTAQGRTTPGRPAEDQDPLGHVQEFDGFTVRANVNRSDVLSDDVAREYGIEKDPDHFLVNVVVLENRPDQQPSPVSAVVSVQHRSLSGHLEKIDMRPVESDGHFTYIGTLDTRGQRMFPLVVEVRPAGADQPLQMEFEVQLETAEDDGHEY